MNSREYSKNRDGSFGSIVAILSQLRRLSPNGQRRTLSDQLRFGAVTYHMVKEFSKLADRVFEITVCRGDAVA